MAEALGNGAVITGTVTRIEPEVMPNVTPVAEIVSTVTLEPSQMWIISEVVRLKEQMTAAQRKAVLQVVRVLIDTAHGV